MPTINSNAVQGRCLKLFNMKNYHMKYYFEHKIFMIYGMYERKYKGTCSWS